MAQENLTPSSRWSARQVMQATLFVVAVIVGFWLIYRFRAVVVALFVAIVIGTAIRPVVDWLSGRGLSRVYAEVLVYALLLFAVAGFLLLVLPMVLEQGTAVINQLEGYYQGFRTFMVNSPYMVLHRLGFQLPTQLQPQNLIQKPQAPAANPGEAAQSAADTVAQAFAYAGILTKALFSIVAVALMSFYWTLEGERAIRSVLLLAPRSRREDLRSVIDAVEAKLGGFIFGETILCLAIGGMQLIAYLLIGLPNALVLAMIAAVMEAVPTVGPILGALPAILIASSTQPSKIIWVLLSTTIIQLLENNVLVPRIMDKSVGVHPLITLLSLAAFSSLLGLTGALLAVPLAAIIQLLINRFFLEAQKESQLQPEGRDRLSYLRLQAREIVQDSQKQLNETEDETEVDQDSEKLEEAIEGLANDLDRILGQAVQPGSTPS